MSTTHNCCPACGHSWTVESEDPPAPAAPDFNLIQAAHNAISMLSDAHERDLATAQLLAHIKGHMGIK